MTSFLALLLITSVSSVTVQLPSDESICFFKELETNVRFTGAYVITGYDESSVDATINAPGNFIDIIWSQHGKREGTWELYTEEGGEYKICFTNKYASGVLLSIEMRSGSERIVPKVTADGINQVGITFDDTFSYLQNITTNLNFQKTREIVHGINLAKLSSQITWHAFFKVLVLIGLTVGQAYILTGLFKSKPNRIV